MIRKTLTTLSLLALLLSVGCSTSQILPLDKFPMRFVFVHENRYLIFHQGTHSQPPIYVDPQTETLRFESFQQWLELSHPLDAIEADLDSPSLSGQGLFILIPMGDFEPRVVDRLRRAIEHKHLCGVPTTSIPPLWPDAQPGGQPSSDPSSHQQE